MYKINFTKEQLTVTANALEFYSRFLAGQWRIPNAMKCKEFENQGKKDDFHKNKNYVENQLDALKTLFTNMPLNASYGIGSEKLHEDAKIAYDIYRPILEEFNKDSENWNVYSSPGLTYSKEGRISINKTNNE